MEVLEFSGLPHNKAPFLTVGGFLFSVPDSSHWADHLHDERTEATSRRSHTNKDGPPGAAVPGGFKGSKASFKTAAASYLVYPTDERTGTYRHTCPES